MIEVQIADVVVPEYKKQSYTQSSSGRSRQSILPIWVGTCERHQSLWSLGYPNEPADNYDSGDC